MTTAVVARKKAQNDITYYKDKLGQEQAVHIDLETKCATVTAEFEVSTNLSPLFESPLKEKCRIGRQRRFNSAQKFRTPVNQMWCSAI